MTGLCGVNCRHSFGSGDGENNPYADINLSSEENIKAEERAKKQRLMERRIRNSKREIQNLQTAIDASGDDKLKFELQQMYDRKSAVLRRQNKQYRDYCKENDLKEYSERLTTFQTMFITSRLLTRLSLSQKRVITRLSALWQWMSTRIGM